MSTFTGVQGGTKIHWSYTFVLLNAGARPVFCAHPNTLTNCGLSRIRFVKHECRDRLLGAAFAVTRGR
jgi:hypothetical protein